MPPGLSDRPEQLAEIVRAARDAGATGIRANLLYLRPGTREHFLEQLARDWPEQLPRYEALYACGSYLRNDVKKPLQELVADLRRRHGINDRRTIRPELAREEQLALAV
jgi:DNA repair photolyase